MAAPRYAYKFTSLDGTTTRYDFPLYKYEYEPAQSLRSPLAAISGAHYPFRHMGSAPALKAAGQERIRFMMVHTSSANLDTGLDEMRSELHSIGLGKLWTYGADDTIRWCYAELTEMPTFTLGALNLLLLPVVLGFTRLSDWYSSTDTTSSAAATGTVVINNPGNAPVYNAVLTLYGTYTNPIITNATALLLDGVTPYKLATLRDGTSNNHRVKFDSGEDSVKYSSDAGATYADDYANFVRQAGQIQLMKLMPGNNSFTFTGCASATLAWSFYGTWY